MLDTWKLALISITLSRYTLESPLGCFLVHPHNNADWYASKDGRHIYHFLGDNNVVSYSRPPNSRLTRRPKYLRDDFSPANLCRFELKLASVFASPDKNSVRLHSVAPQPAPNISSTPPCLTHFVLDPTRLYGTASLATATVGGSRIPCWMVRCVW